jgi:putative inorganic carbon (HCO3(-)) transporter
VSAPLQLGPVLEDDLVPTGPPEAEDDEALRSQRMLPGRHARADVAGWQLRLVLFVVLAEWCAVLLGLLAGAGSLTLLVVAVAGPTVLVAALVRPDVGLLVLVLMLYTRFSDVMVHERGLPSTLQPYLVLMVVAVGMRCLWHRQVPTGLGVPAAALGAYGLVLSLSLFFVDDVEVALYTVTSYVKDMLIVLVVIALLRSGPLLRRTVWTLVLAGLALSSLGVLQYVTGSFGQDFGGFAQASVKNIYGESDDWRISGPIEDPNHYAQTLLVLVPLALGRLQRSGSRLGQLVGAVALAALVLSIVFTFSRGALLALVALLAVAAARRPPPARMWVGVALLAAALLPLLPQGYVDRVQQLSGAVQGLVEGGRTGESSLSGRLSALQAGTRMFAENPVLGVGVGQFETRYREYSLGLGIDVSEGGIEPHNLFVQVAAETGFVGLLAFGGVLGLVAQRLRRGRAALLRLGLRRDAEYVEDLQLAVLAYLIAGLFVHNAYPRFLWLLVAICLAVPHVVEERVAAVRAAARQGWTVLPDQPRPGPDEAVPQDEAPADDEVPAEADVPVHAAAVTPAGARAAPG